MVPAKISSEIESQERCSIEILYIGNIFSHQNQGVTVIETLGTSLEERYRVHYASGKRSRIARLLHMIFSVIALRKRISVVLIDTYSTLNFLYALVISQLCRTLGLPYIPVLHGGNLPERLDLNPRASRAVFTHSRINVAPNAYLETEFKKRKFPVISIPNSIPIEDYSFTRRTVFAPKLLYVRAFSKTYNPTMAVRVLHLLLARFTDARLCMVGPERDGTLYACRRLAEILGIQDKVVFTGQLSKEDWHRLAEQYDIFINTSNFDNMPVSVLEAMALGLPVVSTGPGGIPYLITDGLDGCVVACDDAEAMTERIIDLIENPTVARRLAGNARIKAEKFGTSDVKKHWFELLG